MPSAANGLAVRSPSRDASLLASTRAVSVCHGPRIGITVTAATIEGGTVIGRPCTGVPGADGRRRPDRRVVDRVVGRSGSAAPGGWGGTRQARVTLPALRQPVHTFMRLAVPDTLACTVWMFGFQRRLVFFFDHGTL